MTQPRLQGARVAVLTETEFIPFEMDYYRDHFAEMGATVDFATNLWGAAQRELVADVTTPTMPATMKVTLDVAYMRAADYDIVLQAANYTAVRLREIPPIGSHGSVAEARDVPAVRFFADAMADKRIVKGALCHGLWILTPRPELLRGRRVICHTVVLADIANAGATYVANQGEVIVDDDLVTGRSSKNIPEYVEAIATLAAQRRESK